MVKFYEVAVVLQKSLPDLTSIHLAERCYQVSLSADKFVSIVTEQLPYRSAPSDEAPVGVDECISSQWVQSFEMDCF